MTEITAVCLFDGVGGFPLALRRAGVRTVLSCEIDPAARGVLADHFDHVLHDDVRTLTADDCTAAGFDPRNGIFTAGFPCQDLSVAGGRAGLSGARSGLFFEIVRLADALRPRWLVLENVPGLLSAVCPCPGNGRHDGCTEQHNVSGGACDGGCMANHGGAMGTVVGALGELGYGWAYRVLDAQHFGVPQRRRRVVIVGCLGDRAAPVEVLLEPEGLRGDSAQGGETWPRTAAAADAGARGGRGEVVTVSTLQAGGRPGLASGRRSGSDRPHHPGGIVVSALTASHGGPDDNDAQAGHLVTQAIPLANRGRDGGAQLEVGEAVDPYFALRAGNGGSSRQPMVATITHALTAEGHDASEDGTGRGTPLVPVSLAGAGDFSSSEDLAQSVRSAHGQPGNVATTTAVRRLTPTECERLQGFPDEWSATSWGKPQADSPRYKQMGNAIAVPVFEWVLGRIVALESAAAEDGVA